MATQSNVPKAQFEAISGGRSRYTGFEGQYINGTWRPGRRGRVLKDTNPYAGVDDTPAGPFGGEKNSGLGRFGGEWIIEEFTTSHWITVQHKPRQYPF